MAQQLKEFLTLFLDHSSDWRLTLIKNWHHIFGDMGKHITCEKIEHQIITIGVYDSCWMQELHLLAPSLLNAINSVLDKPHITHIRFKKISPRTKQPNTSHTLSVKKFIPKSLTSIERTALMRVQDYELRTALEKFLYRCQHTTYSHSS